MHAIRRHLCTIALVMVASMLSGCPAIPTGRLDALAKSGNAVHQKFTETNVRIERIQRRFIVMSATAGNLSVDTFKPVIAGVSIDVVPEIRFREDAIEVVARYLDVLQAFARKDFQTDIDAASKDLAGSVKSLADTIGEKKDATDAQKKLMAPVPGILATVVNAIGTAVVEEKRFDAIKTVMPKGQIALDAIAALLESDVQLIKTILDKHLAGMLGHASAARATLKVDTEACFRFDAEMADVIDEVGQVKSALDGISKTATAIGKAHAEAIEVLSKPLTPEDSLRALVAEAKRLNKFYRDLK